MLLLFPDDFHFFLHQRHPKGVSSRGKRWEQSLNCRHSICHSSGPPPTVTHQVISGDGFLDGNVPRVENYLPDCISMILVLFLYHRTSVASLMVCTPSNRAWLRDVVEYKSPPECVDTWTKKVYTSLWCWGSYKTKEQKNNNHKELAKTEISYSSKSNITSEPKTIHTQ